MTKIIHWFYSLRPVWQMFFFLILSTLLIRTNASDKLSGIKEFSFLIIENVKQFGGYFETNTELKQENERLKTLLIKERLEKNRYKNNILENIRLKNLLRLQIPEDNSFEFASVVGESPYPGLKAIVISKGAADSIQKNDVVLSISGLVGKVIEVFPSTSVVQLLLDRNIRVSASVLRNQERGILRFYDNSVLLLDYVVKSVEVKPGDIIVTAPTSQIYPEGLKIGKVVKIENNPVDHFQKIFILPSVNFNNLTEVIVMRQSQ